MWNLLSIALSFFVIPLSLPAQTAADADFDGDGTVGFGDFLLFAKAYNTSQARYDLNGSGRVDFPDFLAFVRVYGQKVGQVEKEKEITADLPGGAKMAFVYVRPGKFLMGSPDSDPWADTPEKPQHEVTITKGFYLGKYEATQGQWVVVIGTTPWSGQSYVQENPDHPAASVSWDDVQEFIKILNRAADAGLYRLPTEAEWEYACRAGTTTRWSFGDDKSLLGEYAWYLDNASDVGEDYAHKVGAKKPNPWGLYDMHGNVWEWCQDWYSGAYYSSSPPVDPQGPESGTLRVVRGGFFGRHAQHQRSALRDSPPPSARDGRIGFRLLRQAD